jgi:hypothetical protein
MTGASYVAHLPHPRAITELDAASGDETILTPGLNLRAGNALQRRWNALHTGRVPCWAKSFSCDWRPCCGPRKKPIWQRTIGSSRSPTTSSRPLEKSRPVLATGRLTGEGRPTPPAPGLFNTPTPAPPSQIFLDQEGGAEYAPTGPKPGSYLWAPGVTTEPASPKPTAQTSLCPSIGVQPNGRASAPSPRHSRWAARVGSHRGYSACESGWIPVTPALLRALPQRRRDNDQATQVCVGQATDEA